MRPLPHHKLIQSALSECVVASGGVALFKTWLIPFLTFITVAYLNQSTANSASKGPQSLLCGPSLIKHK